MPSNFSSIRAKHSPPIKLACFLKSQDISEDEQEKKHPPNKSSFFAEIPYVFFSTRVYKEYPQKKKKTGKSKEKNIPN